MKNLIINEKTYKMYSHCDGSNCVSLYGVTLAELENIKTYLENNFNNINMDNVVSIFFKDRFDGYILFE